MNIGIIIFSKTGNTLSVGKKLHDTLLTKGHSVVLNQVTASDDTELDPEKILPTNSPSTQGYDMIVFAAPVHSAKLPGAMQAYLQQIPSLEAKLVAGFVTQLFPFPSWGGNQTIQALDNLLRLKGSKLSATGVINWLFPRKRKALIAETIEKITALSD